MALSAFPNASECNNVPLTETDGKDGSRSTVLGTRLPSSLISFPFVHPTNSAAEMMEKYRISLGSTTKIREILTTNGFSHSDV